jgi:hypothetical protein
MGRKKSDDGGKKEQNKGRAEKKILYPIGAWNLECIDAHCWRINLRFTRRRGLEINSAQLHAWSMQMSHHRYSWPDIIVARSQKFKIFKGWINAISSIGANHY